MLGRIYIFVTLVFSCFFISLATANADRLKDMTSIAGVRSNQLVGYGLVVGLAGTGDGNACLLYTSPSPRDQRGSRMPSSA